MMYSYVQAMTPYTEPFKNIVICIGKEMYIYVFWVAVHHFVPQIYAQYCSTTLYNTLFVAPSNICKGLRWLMLSSGDSLTAMWYILGMWILKKIPSVLVYKV
jgi:hypothetical protein